MPNTLRDSDLAGIGREAAAPIHDTGDSHRCYESDYDSVGPLHDLLLMIVIRLQVIPMLVGIA